MKKEKTIFAWEKNKLVIVLLSLVIFLGLSVVLNQYLSRVFRPADSGTAGKDSAPLAFSGWEEKAVAAIPSSQADFERQSFVASPDGKRFAYILKKEGRESVVLDASAGASYDAITFLSFSPDGKRFAYGAKLNGHEMVVLDGREGKLYDWIFTPRSFSPDSRYFYYKARTGEGDILVFNDRESRAYDRIYEPFVSADGSSLIYYGLVGDAVWQGKLGLEAKAE